MNDIWILGPCAAESESLLFEVGSYLSQVMARHHIANWYLKASFDKGNRTRLTSPRGPGLDEGARIYRSLKERLPGVKFITDVHETWQVEKLAGVVDAIQIPAFLCKQTDLLVEAGRCFSHVNVKRGQWVSPNTCAYIPEKVRKHNDRCKVWLTERGTAFGYDRLLVDFSAVDEFKKHFDAVILDCTHATQIVSPTGFTGGNPELAGRFLTSASCFGYQGIFAEVHPRPHESPSDAHSMIPLSYADSLIGKPLSVGAVLK